MNEHNYSFKHITKWMAQWIHGQMAIQTDRQEDKQMIIRKRDREKHRLDRYADILLNCSYRIEKNFPRNLGVRRIGLFCYFVDKSLIHRLYLSTHLSA